MSVSQPKKRLRDARSEAFRQSAQQETAPNFVYYTAGVRRGTFLAITVLVAVGLVYGKNKLQALATEQAPAHTLPKAKPLLAQLQILSAQQAQRNRKIAKEGPTQPEYATATPHLDDLHGNLARFFEKLSALQEAPEQSRRLVRASMYGSSEIGFDRVTSQVRRRMQQRFGDGGKGFVVISPGWRYQRHQDVIWEPNDKWNVFTVRKGERDDGRYGIGGVLAINEGVAQVTYKTLPPGTGADAGYEAFPSGSKFSKLRIFFHAHPTGGLVEIHDNDKDARVATIQTKDDFDVDKVTQIAFDDGPHSVTLKTNDELNMLYGVSLERETGFIFDALMVVGAWAHTNHNFDTSHYKSQLALLNTDLFVFQYGAKEVFRNPDMTDEEASEFSDNIIKTVELARLNDPQQPCLIISSKDMGKRERGKIVTRQAIKKVVAGAERAARLAKCAYFNLFEAMGGEGTMEKWWNHDPKLVSPDLGHVMDEGAIVTGDLITDALMQAYDVYHDKLRGD